MEQGSKTERDFAEALSLHLMLSFDSAEPDDQPIDPDTEVTTFANEEILSANAGLIVRLPDGREFQLTVVQSKGQNEDES